MTMQSVEEREGYACGWVLVADEVTVDSAIVFPSRQAAYDWCKERSISLDYVSIRPLMDSRSVHWM